MTADPAGPAQAARPAEGLALPALEEPEALRTSLREAVLAGGDLDQGLCAGEGSIGAWLWARWRAALEPAGMSEAAFLAVVAGYRRELWFWLLGDRGWTPLVEGLGGRVARRILVA